MLGQLGCTTYAVFDEFQWLFALKLVLIVLVWLSTFVYFAPTHERISSGNFSYTTLYQIVKFNWFRTIVWTLVAILSFLYWNFKTKKPQKITEVLCTRDGTRTHTPKEHWILNPTCLPIPPLWPTARCRSYLLFVDFLPRFRVGIANLKNISWL